MSYLSFSKHWTSHLTAKAGVSSEKEVILAYIIEVLALKLFGFLVAIMLILGNAMSTSACAKLPTRGA